MSQHHRRFLVLTSSSVAVCWFVFCPVVPAARGCPSPHLLRVGFDGCCSLAVIRDFCACSACAALALILVSITRKKRFWVCPAHPAGRRAEQTGAIEP